MSTADPPRSAQRCSLVLVAVAAALAALLLPGSLGGNRRRCANRNNNTYGKLLDCVTLEGVRAHQAAFQAIADANGGNRAAGTPGYEASVDYVVDKLEAAGWSVAPHEFDFTVAQPIQQHTPIAATHASGGVTGSALGTVNNPVTPIDINLVPPRANTSGCQGAFTEAAVGAPLTADPGRSERLRGLRRRPDRAGPAGRLQLRPQGRERPDRRRGRSDPVQPGQHARPQRHPHATSRRSRRPARPSRRSPSRWSARASPPARCSPRPGTTATVAVVNDPQTNVIAELDGDERQQRRHGRSSPRLRRGRAPGSTTTAPARRRCSRRR